MQKEFNIIISEFRQPESAKLFRAKIRNSVSPRKLTASAICFSFALHTGLLKHELQQTDCNGLTAMD